MEIEKYIDSSDSETESNSSLELNDKQLSNWLKHRKKIQDLSHHLKTEFLQDINQFILDFEQINASTLHDKRIKKHIRDHIYLMDMHRNETKNSIFKYYHDDPVFNYFDGDLYRHEIAVYLNTECGMIYDIATCVAEYVDRDLQNKPFISYYNS